MKFASGEDDKLEIFAIGGIGLRFDITRAKRLVGFPYAKPDGTIAVRDLFDSGVGVSPRHAAKANLHHPVIVGTVGGWLFLIDGNHRAYRANWLKRKTLPCYVLSEDETASCALHPHHPYYDKDTYKSIRDTLLDLPPNVRVKFG